MDQSTAHRWPMYEGTVRPVQRVADQTSGVAPSSGRAETATSDRQSKEVKARCGKRKATGSLSADSIVPTKIFVNEKHVASCLSRLTLDNNNAEDQPDLEEEPWFDVEMVVRRSQSEINFSLHDRVNTNSNSKLVLYHELQLGLRKAPFLCDFIQDEIKKPEMQVVLWKPPGGVVKNAIEALRGNMSHSMMNRQKHFTSEIVHMATKPFNNETRLLESVDMNVSKTATVSSKLAVMYDEDIETENQASLMNFT